MISGASGTRCGDTGRGLSVVPLHTNDNGGLGRGWDWRWLASKNRKEKSPVKNASPELGVIVLRVIKILIKSLLRVKGKQLHKDSFLFTRC